MNTVVRSLGLLAIAILLAWTATCSDNNDNSHTTATTFVTPPPRQVLRAETRPAKVVSILTDPGIQIPERNPSLKFNLPNGKTFREGEEVVIDFSLAHAKLKGDGGDFRVRYFVDDDEMKWIDRWEQVVLTGWTPGKHTIRIELVGPDGWPLRDNIFTREITVIK